MSGGRCVSVFFLANIRQEGIGGTLALYGAVQPMPSNYFFNMPAT